MRTKFLLATAAVALLIVSMQAQDAATAHSPISKAASASESSNTKTTRVTLPLESPQSLADVLQITEARGYPVQAYRFENPEIAGEYSPQTGGPISEYLADFEKMYGTQPQFVSVIVDLPVATAEKWYRAGDLNGIAVRGTVFRAEKANRETIDNLLREHREQARGSYSEMSTNGYGDWKPEQADIKIFRIDSSTVYFEQFYYWNGTDTRAAWMPTGYGIEMEINIRADSASYQSGLRPFCNGGYKDQPFAKNYGWTWSALVNTGSGMTGVSSAVGAYADYNDLSDACGKNSMAIGFKSPAQLPSYPNGANEVLVTIIAPRGVENSGYIGGLVQSVNSPQCSVFPWMALTDCMGVSSGSVGNRPTLGEYRNWRAPDKCWLSFNYGNDAPFDNYC